MNFNLKMKQLRDKQDKENLILFKNSNLRQLNRLAFINNRLLKLKINCVQLKNKKRIFKED